jgi:hypothetical protein
MGLDQREDAVSSYYEFKSGINVYDEDLLLACAITRVLSDRCRNTEAEARELLAKDGKIDVETCLVMLLDPGQLCDGEAGAEIEYSSCEHVMDGM